MLLLYRILLGWINFSKYFSLILTKCFVTYFDVYFNNVDFVFMKFDITLNYRITLFVGSNLKVSIILFLVKFNR